MKKLLGFILVLICVETLAQQRRIIAYNLFERTSDTLLTTEFDSTLLREKTDYYSGKYDSEYNLLSIEIPTENIFPGSQFTFKKRASDDYEINKFPIRTSVKLFKWENDSLKSKCSGCIISRKHVLTACHCVAPLYKDSLLYDSMYISPAFNNGLASSEFEGSWVKKIYLFQNWNSTIDFSILELENPVGENTGWISIGFDSDNEDLLNGMFYKFTYPATTIPEIDPGTYNGDTLYYGYGLADYAGDNNIMIMHTTAIPGESGSSLIKIENETKYTGYGVLSFSANMNHCRLTNWKFFAIKDIIKGELSSYEDIIETVDQILIYPNPANTLLHIKLTDDLKINEISLFNSMGRKVNYKDCMSVENTLDISELPAGIYFIILEGNNGRIVRKIIKSER